MTEIINILNDPLGLFLTLVLLLVWFFYLPMVVAPLVVLRWHELPQKWKSLLVILFPTLERALLDIWTRVAYELEQFTLATETTLDDEMLKRLDEETRYLIQAMRSARDDGGPTLPPEPPEPLI